MPAKKHKPIKVPMYDWWVFLIVGEEERRELEEEWDFQMDEDVMKGAKAVCVPMEFTSGRWNEKEFNILYFNPKYFSASVLVHECVHSIHFMMQSRGIPVSMDNTEVMAYGTEYLFNECIKRIGKEE